MSKIEDRVIAKIEARAELGRRKYGTTMERKDLTFRQWVTHLQEELLDAAIYAEKLIDEISIPEMKKKHDNDVPALAHELPKAIDAWGIYDEEMILIKSYPEAYIAIEEANIMMSRNKNKTFVVKKYTLWQAEQDINWFNEYQEVENYIINRIGDNFLEATPEKYETASQATIALLEANWQK